MIVTTVGPNFPTAAETAERSVGDIHVHQLTGGKTVTYVLKERGWQMRHPAQTFKPVSTISADKLVAGQLYLPPDSRFFPKPIDPVAIMEEPPEEDLPRFHFPSFLLGIFVITVLYALVAVTLG